MEQVEEDVKNNLYIFKCPHCKDLVEVLRDQIACQIFRHGAFFVTFPNGSIQILNQMNPHESKERCDKLFEEGKILGCGKPFKFIYNQNGKHHVEICEYI